MPGRIDLSILGNIIFIFCVCINAILLLLALILGQTASFWSSFYTPDKSLFVWDFTIIIKANNCYFAEGQVATIFCRKLFKKCSLWLTEKAYLI